MLAVLPSSEAAKIKGGKGVGMRKPFLSKKRPDQRVIPVWRGRISSRVTLRYLELHQPCVSR